MASEADFPARGKVTAIKDSGAIVFAPSNTNYELHLQAGGTYDGPVGRLVEGYIRVNARKVYSMPSGGNFLAPIFGPPKIVQGRVRYVSEKVLVLQAGAPIVVHIPRDDMALDLASGPIRMGTMVNVTCLPGATFELVGVAAIR